MTNKMKTKNPSIDELKQERDHWKIRAINQGSDISEFCAQIDRSADELQRWRKRLRKLNMTCSARKWAFAMPCLCCEFMRDKMKTKNPNPTPADEIAALEQEVDFMKDRGREMGKAFTEAMLQITDQAKQIEGLKRDNDRLLKKLQQSRLG